jgi:UDP-N-acetylmuramate dehydrogenase
MPKGLVISGAPALKRLTTIRLGGTPIARVVVDEPEGFDHLAATLERLGGSPVVLGNGSNILAHDGDLPLVLLELGRSFTCQEPTVLREDGDNVTVCAGAAMPLPLFVSRLAAMGLDGLTGLAGIPGQLGGAIAQNAGSFGSEIKDCLSGVSIFSPPLGRVVLKAGELDMGYRNFRLPQLEGVSGSSRNWFIIDGAEFRLRKAPAEELQARARECIRKKRESQPVADARAGCVFKNTEAGPAGMLLEKSGLKGQSKGGMSFSALHANFMVNDGTGRSDQAFALIDEARYMVMDHFGVSLELEVKVWP